MEDTRKIKKSDLIYYARIISNAGIYEVIDLKVRTVTYDYIVGTENRTKTCVFIKYQ